MFYTWSFFSKFLHRWNPVNQIPWTEILKTPRETEHDHSILPPQNPLHLTTIKQIENCQRQLYTGGTEYKAKRW